MIRITERDQKNREQQRWRDLLDDATEMFRKAGRHTCEDDSPRVQWEKRQAAILEGMKHAAESIAALPDRPPETITLNEWRNSQR